MSRDEVTAAFKDARTQLRAALQDGALTAYGQISVVADDAKRAADWPGTESTVLRSEAFGPITSDWWIGVNLDVEVLWHANAASRRMGSGYEVMRAIRCRMQDLERIWPRKPLSRTQAEAAEQAIRHRLTHIGRQDKPLTKEQAKDATRTIDGWSAKAFEGAWSSLEQGLKRKRGERGRDQKPERISGRKKPQKTSKKPLT